MVLLELKAIKEFDESAQRTMPESFDDHQTAGLPAIELRQT